MAVDYTKHPAHTDVAVMVNDIKLNFGDMANLTLGEAATKIIRVVMESTNKE